MELNIQKDLWQYLANAEKTIVMYGMGNGADKILDACRKKGIAVSDFFASDGFVRGHLFHGVRVKSWSEIKELYGAENVIVLLSFGSSRPEVLENIMRIASEAELYAPDVPAFGDGLFDMNFYLAHREQMEAVLEILSDEESKRIYQNVIAFKLTGDISYLMQAESDPEEVMKNLICPHTLQVTADLGAYNGDTVRELLEASEGKIKKIYAMEPDVRNYRKLEAYAKEETRAQVIPIQAGAWSEDTVLSFEAEGNRNATLVKNQTNVDMQKGQRVREIAVMRLDSVLGEERADYIKYDVEGSEKQAIVGSFQSILANLPTLLVSMYHRNEDLFDLPLLLRTSFPAYTKYHLRRFRGIPAWDLNLYVKR